MRHGPSRQGGRAADLQPPAGAARRARPARQQLAEAIGVNYQTIGYLERGEYSPSLDHAFRLAEYFDLPIEAIFARERFTPTSRQTPTPVLEETT